MEAKAALTMLGKCSLCGTDRADHELNGVSSLGAVGRRYERAFCIHIADCNGKVVKGDSRMSVCGPINGTKQRGRQEC